MILAPSIPSPLSRARCADLEHHGLSGFESISVDLPDEADLDSSSGPRQLPTRSSTMVHRSGPTVSKSKPTMSRR